jgi:hypothetical protein
VFEVVLGGRGTGAGIHVLHDSEAAQRMGLRQSVTIAPGTMRTTPGGAATEPSAHVPVLSRRVTTYRIDVDAFE